MRKVLEETEQCRDFPSAVLWAFGLRYSGDDRCDARRANGGKKSPIELLNAVEKDRLC